MPVVSEEGQHVQKGFLWAIGIVLHSSQRGFQHFGQGIMFAGFPHEQRAVPDTESISSIASGENGLSVIDRRRRGDASRI